MSFDLAFWHEDQPITSEQALQIYEQLCDAGESGTVVTPHPNIAAFLQDLAQYYPPIDDYPEEKWDECPWSTIWSVTPGSVICCMTWSRGPGLASFLIEMANRYDLVVYDPQHRKVFLPPSLVSP